MKTIKIQASDTLFFRDGKPFEMGDDNWANGMFPNMTPGVLLGALRASHASWKGIEKTEIASKTEQASICNYGLLLRDDVAFPFPLDMVGYKDENETVALNLEDNLASSNPFSKILLGNANAKTQDMDKYWMKPNHFEQYMNGKTNFKYGYKNGKQNELLDLSEFITVEPKIGIGRDRYTNTAREGALYRVGMTRLQGRREGNVVSLFATVKDLELEESGILRLGAESKVATYNEIEGLSNPIAGTDWGESGIFKAYLFTPAILKLGILPNWVDEQFEGEISGVKVRLLTCVVGRFLSFGGFDLKEYRPKLMKKAVPAGSVYYFELIDKTAINTKMQNIVSHFQNHSFSEERANEGLGVTFITKYHQA